MRRRKNFERLRGKRIIRFAVNRLFYIKLLHAEVDHIFCFEEWRHLCLHFRRIIAAYAEDDDIGNITKHGVQHFGQKLRGVLVSHRQIDAVFARLAEEIDKGAGNEVMELIGVQIKIMASIFGYFRSRHARLFYFGNEHGAEKTGVLLADLALGQIDKQNLFAVRQFLEIDFVFFLREDVAQGGHGKKLAQFVDQRDNGIGVKFLRPVGKFHREKALYHVVGDVLNHFLAVRAVGQHRNHAAHSGIGIIEEC